MSARPQLFTGLLFGLSGCLVDQGARLLLGRLSQLSIPQREGSVPVCSDPRLLEAGLWTIGLATSGAQCGLSLSDWQSLTPADQKSLRTVATLELYRLGAHSVIDDLGDLSTCLDDLARRRAKGEKP